MKRSVSISIDGLVQGVGFRPFIYRLAKKYDLKGSVVNRTDGVLIEVAGNEELIDDFKAEILKLAPPASFIKNIESTYIDSLNSNDFKILPSQTIENQITGISPDIAVCNDCLSDLKKQSNRIDYPFINCTNCGPRFTIISKLPYDRNNTCMQKFEMCEKCKTEYNDVSDRRFHAQPVACNNCGPQYTYNNISDFNEIVHKVADKIHEGGIVAVKGLGGYNLICDATSNPSVIKLREMKGRDGKPFAVMFKNINLLNEYCYLNRQEKETLKSWQCPIVLLNQKKKLCDSVNNGLNNIGAMLPYLPFHYLLFEKLKIPAIVYTSLNNSGEPIIADDHRVEKLFSDKVNAIVAHNREIKNPIDDSVVRFVNQRQQMIRRARGYVPLPIYVNNNVDGIFAAGAELKNTFCIGKGDKAILSQHIGDLKNYETYNTYKDAVNTFFDLFNFIPRRIACDLHPDYLSTRFAKDFNCNQINGSKLPVIKVQHHHAHIVSCMAEHRLNEKVIGVCFDGTGYGNDGNIWGGEFLISTLGSFERYAHFDYVGMPGGDLVIEEPWRMALAYLKKYFINKTSNLRCFRTIDELSVDMVSQMLVKNVNLPLTSSAGRLFDVVACLLSICAKQNFEAEGPMRLEAIIDIGERFHYPFQIKNNIVLFDKTLDAILNELHVVQYSIIAAKFHNTIVQVILEMAKKMKKDTGINKVVLSGGVFQNKYLLEKSIDTLTEHKFETYTNHLTPPNDGGIALGQLIIATNTI